MDVDEFDRILRVNLRGTMLALRASLQHMRNRSEPCSIVCVTSVAAHRTGHHLGAYSASKRGMLGLVAAAAAENGPLVRVNSLAPGVIDTPLLHFGGDTLPEEVVQRMRTVPLGRVGRPAEVAAMALWLLSSEASFVTGGAFIADGGSLG